MYETVKTSYGHDTLTFQMNKQTIYDSNTALYTTFIALKTKLNLLT